MLDVSGFNSAMCFMEKKLRVYERNQKRQNVLSDLSDEFSKPQIERRFLAEQAKLPKYGVCMGVFVTSGGS